MISVAATDVPSVPLLNPTRRYFLTNASFSGSKTWKSLKVYGAVVVLQQAPAHRGSDWIQDVVWRCCWWLTLIRSCVFKWCPTSKGFNISREGSRFYLFCFQQPVLFQKSYKIITDHTVQQGSNRPNGSNGCEHGSFMCLENIWRSRVDNYIISSFIFIS